MVTKVISILLGLALIYQMVYCQGNVTDAILTADLSAEDVEHVAHNLRARDVLAQLDAKNGTNATDLAHSITARDVLPQLDAKNGTNATDVEDRFYFEDWTVYLPENKTNAILLD